MNRGLFWNVLAVGEGRLGERASSLLSIYRMDLVQKYGKELANLQKVTSQNDPEYRRFEKFVNKNW